MCNQPEFKSTNEVVSMVNSKQYLMPKKPGWLTNFNDMSICLRLFCA